MGRTLTYSVSGSAISAAVDLFELVAGTQESFKLKEIVLGQTTDYGDAAAEGLQLLIKRASGSYTSGSGGSTITAGNAPRLDRTADGDPDNTAETGNTTQASAGSGALQTLRAEGFNIQVGYQYLPPPSDQYRFGPAEALVISLSAPADSVTWNYTIVLEVDG